MTRKRQQSGNKRSKEKAARLGSEEESVKGRAREMWRIRKRKNEIQATKHGKEEARQNKLQEQGINEGRGRNMKKKQRGGEEKTDKIRAMKCSCEYRKEEELAEKCEER